MGAWCRCSRARTGVPRQGGGGDEAMQDRIDKSAVVLLVMQRTGREQVLVEEILDAALEEIYDALKRGESVSLRNFGSFYVRPETEQWVFRFNPAQRLRKAFGWSSTYRGGV
jgi:DNA-binding protein HU-beta